MRVLILLVMVLVPNYGFAFDEEPNDYSWAELQMKHKPLKPVMEQYKVVPEPVTPVDRSVLMSGQRNVDPEVLIAVGSRVDASLPVSPLSRSLTTASPQEMQVVSIETTVDDWKQVTKD